MDSNELQSSEQYQHSGNSPASITIERLLQQAKINMRRFEKLIFFAINFYLLSLILMLTINVITDLFTNRPMNFSYISLLNQVPVLVVIVVLYYFLKVKKYDSDVMGFIKSSLLKIRTIIGSFGAYILYVIIAIWINWTDFIKVASTNTTIISLTLLLMFLIAAYIVYVYMTVFKPIYSGFKQLREIISNQ